MYISYSSQKQLTSKLSVLTYTDLSSNIAQSLSMSHREWEFNVLAFEVVLVLVFGDDDQ